MFTIEQIIAAHSKVKSGSDFPAYIKDLKKLGVLNYQTYVTDGHTNYFGENDYEVSSTPKYEVLNISSLSNIKQFKTDIKAHQQGKTNYQTFCNDCAKSSVEKWIVDIQKMTCTYYDKVGNVLLVEQIPN